MVTNLIGKKVRKVAGSEEGTVVAIAYQPERAEVPGHFMLLVETGDPAKPLLVWRADSVRVAEAG